MRPEILNPLFCNIDNLKGVGARYLKLISNLVGGSKIADVLWHLPYHIIDRTYSCPLQNVEAGRIWTGVVTVSQHLEPKTKKQPYRVICDDETGDVTLNFFKFYKDSLKKQMPIGQKKLISGKLQWFNGQLQMSHPDYITDVSVQNMIQTIEPVYPLTSGITNKMMLSIVNQALSKVPDLPEWLDEYFVKEKNLPNFKQALYCAHKPKNIADLDFMSPARLRLAYDELLANQLTLSLARRYHKKKEGR